MTNFHPKPRDMTIPGKSLCQRADAKEQMPKSRCQKVVKLLLYCHNFQYACPKSVKTIFSDSSYYELSKKSFT